MSAVEQPQQMLTVMATMIIVMQEHGMTVTLTPSVLLAITALQTTALSVLQRNVPHTRTVGTALVDAAMQTQTVEVSNIAMTVTVVLLFTNARMLSR